MIYTLTFNPALDYVITLDAFKEGAVNRTKSEAIYLGGKGINVSRVLSHLNVENKALGFIAGFTGTHIENELKQMGINTQFIQLEEGLSRINVKVKADCETEINGQGPKITEEALSTLFSSLSTLQAGDILVLAGSIPNTLPQDIYERIMKHLEAKAIDIVVDATKELLINVLPHKPFLIKPNNHELGELFNVTLTSTSDIIYYAKKLQEKGARNVLISMAKDGAILVTEEGSIHQMGVPKGVVVNSVGAGDSMVAGFIAGYSKTHDYLEALRLGTACGSATAFTSDLATHAEIMTQYETCLTL